MYARRTLFALVLAALVGNAAAQQPSPYRTGALPVPANRIVGLWAVDATIRPCSGGPALFTFTALFNYQAGGTLTESAAFDPTTRGPGMGIWEYQDHGRYKVRFFSQRYLPDGSFDGLSEAKVNLILDPTATAFTHTAIARVYNADGSLRVELCASASGKRVPID